MSVVFERCNWTPEAHEAMSKCVDAKLSHYKRAHAAGEVILWRGVHDTPGEDSYLLTMPQPIVEEGFAPGDFDLHVCGLTGRDSLEVLDAIVASAQSEPAFKRVTWDCAYEALPALIATRFANVERFRRYEIDLSAPYILDPAPAKKETEPVPSLELGAESEGE